MREKQKQRDIIGLLPASGKTSRIAPLPCGKELYPIGFRSVDRKGSVRPKVVSHYLLENNAAGKYSEGFHNTTRR